MSMFCDRGTVYIVKGESSKGMYSVPGIEGKFTLINSMDIEEMDSFAAVATLDDQQIMYVFGKDTGNVKVAGEILLGTVGDNEGVGEIKKMADWFEQNRVSKKSTPVRISIAGAGAMSVYVVGLVFGAVNTELNILPFAIIGKTINSGKK